MKKYSLKIISLVLAILCAALPLTSYAETTAEPGQSNTELSKEDAVSYFDQAVNIIMSRYKFDITKEEIFKNTLMKMIENDPEILDQVFDGMFGSLDDYSVYYTQEELDSFVTNVSGEFCGIGVVITTVESGLFVTTVYDDSPAKESGLMVGDIIVKVGDFSLAGVDISIAQSKILGEENTPVNLTILRNGTYFEINPVRRKVTVESGFYQIVENTDIGYIFFTDFNDYAVQLTKKALSYFDENGINKIIIDLRNNPGGELTSYTQIASMFIPEGVSIGFEYKNPFNNFSLYSDNKEVKYNLALLINSKSASASEAFAAAVKDTKTGVLIGETTFGKGTMQILTRFKIGGGVKLTEAEFLSPLGNRINKIGVSPNFEVEDKLLPYENVGFEKITYDRVLKIGDTGKDVLAVEQRLYALGYDIGLADSVYDQKTHDAVLRLQSVTGLYPYGVCDITTQLKIEEVLQGTKIYDDATFKKAVEIFSDDTWKKYIASPVVK